MSGRRVCSACGASYHIAANPPKTEGTCDLCGGELMVRQDDTPETVRRRLAVYHQQTEALKDFYAEARQAPACGGESAHRGREPRDSRGDRCVT